MENNIKPTILVTNDDGVDAPGIKVLIELLKPYGNILVVAPDRGQSAKSHAITLNDPLYLNKISEEKGLTIYSSNGTAVDCAKLALNEIMDKKPDFLFSGINHGTNSSISIIYSGTMGAALEGCIHGIKSIGFSVLDYTPNPDFSVARHYGKEIIERIILGNEMPDGACINVNFPNVRVKKIKGIKVCRQAKSAWIEEFEKHKDLQNKDYFLLRGYFKNYEPDATDTDDWALNNKYISIVPVMVDFTHHEHIKKLKGLEK